MKTYILIYWYNGKSQEILRGPAGLMQFKKSQLKAEAQFQKGRLTIISESALKYNSAYIKK